MKIIPLFFLLKNFLCLFSTDFLKPKLCKDCIFYKRSTLTPFDLKYGKCTLFPLQKYNNNYLVDGSKQIVEIDHHFCSIAREYDSLCGKEGNQFIKNPKKGFF